MPTVERLLAPGIDPGGVLLKQAGRLGPLVVGWGNCRQVVEAKTRKRHWVEDLVLVSNKHIDKPGQGEFENTKRTQSDRQGDSRSRTDFYKYVHSQIEQGDTVEIRVAYWIDRPDTHKHPKLKGTHSVYAGNVGAFYQVSGGSFDRVYLLRSLLDPKKFPLTGFKSELATESVADWYKRIKSDFNGGLDLYGNLSSSTLVWPKTWNGTLIPEVPDPPTP